MALPSVPPR